MKYPDNYFPERIVCLTEEPTKVSAFTTVDIDKIVKLQPDLVIGFSDMQADIAKQLISNVWINNHRSIEEIYK